MKNKTNYNKSEIMKKAWEILKKEGVSWSECLTKSWNLAKNGTTEITFTHVYNKHYKQILNFVRSRVNNRTEIAEEITQDVFLQVHKHIDNYDVHLAKFTTWLFTIAKNKIIDHYRANVNKSKLMVLVDGWVNDEGKETFEFISDYYVEDIETHETQDAIENAMSSLNKKEQAIANYYFLQDKQYNEISEILKIPMGSVKGTISRLRVKLQDKLQNVYANM